jgi:type IV pilus assembly protein PilP
MGASTIKKLVALSLAVLAIGGCSGDMDDLDEYINTVKARPGGRIDPLPEITPYEVFTYKADIDGLRSPFVPDSPQAATGMANSGTRPDRERSREFLEQFPLDTLRMVGTLSQGDTDYGLVQTSDGLIHRVVPGQYMGQNDGRITTIQESEIELVEIISDGIGGYVERDAAVGLAD